MLIKVLGPQTARKSVRVYCQKCRRPLSSASSKGGEICGRCLKKVPKPVAHR